METSKILKKATLAVAIASMAVGTEVTLAPKAHAQTSGTCPSGWNTVPGKRYNYNGNMITECPTMTDSNVTCCRQAGS